MNKFKVGDIVLAIADNREFVKDEKNKLFIVIELRHLNQPAIIIDNCCGNHRYTSNYCLYYEYKFRKATRTEVKKFKFDYMINKLKDYDVKTPIENTREKIEGHILQFHNILMNSGLTMMEMDCMTRNYIEMITD